MLFDFIPDNFFTEISSPETLDRKRSCVYNDTSEWPQIAAIRFVYSSRFGAQVSYGKTDSCQCGRIALKKENDNG